MKVKKLFGNRLVIKFANPEDKTPGGVLLPQTAQERPKTAKVVKVGTGFYLNSGKQVKPDVSEGDTVLVRDRDLGDKLSENVYVISMEDVLAVVTPGGDGVITVEE